MHSNFTNMINYENEIMDLIPGETPKEKHLNLLTYIGAGETNTEIIDGLNKLRLNRFSRIEFSSGDQNENRVRVHVLPDGDVEVSTDSRMMKRAIIVPHASNMFYIKFIDL